MRICHIKTCWGCGTVADVDAVKRVDDCMVQIWKLKFCSESCNEGRFRITILFPIALQKQKMAKGQLLSILESKWIKLLNWFGSHMSSSSTNEGQASWRSTVIPGTQECHLWHSKPEEKCSVCCVSQNNLMARKSDFDGWTCRAPLQLAW